MTKFKKHKDIVLDMPFGTAAQRLRKSIMFDLIKKLNLDICFRCGQVISEISELSIDHKISWEYSKEPIKLFFDLDNIAFSHLHCNIAFGNKPKLARKPLKHGTHTSYTRGCKCGLCKEAHNIYNKKHKKKFKHRDNLTLSL